MKLLINKKTGRVIFYPRREPKPDDTQFVKTASDADMELFKAGGKLLWRPEDTEKPEGPGQLVKDEPTAVDEYIARRNDLRRNLVFLFAEVQEAEERSMLYPIFTAMNLAFDNGEALEVIKAMIEQTDVSGHAKLKAIKKKMLDLPQWTDTKEKNK